VLAVTAVAGNTSIEKTTNNALRIIDAIGKKTPVYAGAGKPLRRAGEQIEAESIHGADGLGNSELPAPRTIPSKAGALNATLKLLDSHKPKELSIIATGPLTNIATLIEKAPSMAQKIDRIYMMGGTFDPLVRGNVTEHAEFNFYCDPEAAKTVFDFAEMKISSEQRPTIVASGLDATSTADCAITANSLSAICSLKSKAAEVACRILQFPIRTYSYFNLHDVFTLYSAVHPEIFKLESCGGVNIACEDNFRGRCTVRPGSGKVVICRQVNSIKFNQFLMDGLSQGV
jgi:inosine-uridine nucleoside N-ribohydrolase